MTNLDQLETGMALTRLVDDDTAATQRKKALAAVDRHHWNKLVKDTPTIELPEPANDNQAEFKHKETLHLMEQLNRTVFEPDAVTRVKFKDTVMTIRELLDTARTDVVGFSVHRAGKPSIPDYDVQRTDKLKFVPELGLELLREGHADPDTGEYPVKRFRRSRPLNEGYRPDQDDFISERIIDAKTQLGDLSAVVGPLWQPLLWAIDENAGFKEVAERLGYAAHAVGSAVIKMALEAATRHIRAMKNNNNFRDYVAKSRIPVSADRFQRALRAAA